MRLRKELAVAAVLGLDGAEEARCIRLMAMVDTLRVRGCWPVELVVAVVAAVIE